MPKAVENPSIEVLKCDDPKCDYLHFMITNSRGKVVAALALSDAQWNKLSMIVAKAQAQKAVRQ